MKNTACLSRQFAESLEGKETQAIISITSSEDETEANFCGEWGKILRLKFDSYDERHDGKILFEEFHARRVIDFVDSLPKTVEDVYVHCSEGIHRSASITLFLINHFDCELDFNLAERDTDYYNKYIYNILEIYFLKNNKK